MAGFTRAQERLLNRLNSPSRIQDFLDKLPINFEPNGDTCKSPKQVLETGTAHCIEGALLAACVLQRQGEAPLVLDLRVISPDFDHVMALFTSHGRYGAISKTNHAVLRFREPIYKTVRELALSCFHEYFTDNGQKTLREYSGAINLARFNRRGWETADKDVWYIAEYIDLAKHYPFLRRGQSRTLRRASQIEIKAGQLTEWQQRRRKNQ
jgi:hypothetical protein